MAAPLSRFSAATAAFWVTTTVSVASLGALGALAISLAVSNSDAAIPAFDMLLAAGALEIACMLSTMFAASFFILRVAHRTQLVCCTGFALLALAGMITMILSLVHTDNWNDSLADDNVDSDSVATLAKAGFALSAVSILSQLGLYVIILWPYQQKHSDLPANELAARLQQSQSLKRSMSVRLTAFSSPRSSPVGQPTPNATASHFSSPSLSPRSSFRRSVSHVVRPVTSKTRLLFRSSTISGHPPSMYSARDTSLETARPHNEFRDWDTSGAMRVEEQHDSFISTTKSTKTRLEPIPGSRPVSPAKPLNGPFAASGGDTASLPNSPTTSSPVLLPRSDFGSIRSRPRALSRPHSNHSQEAHIHPLFRSESPVPPPIASPNTIITASPHAGQVVSSEQGYFPPPRVLRSAHGSRPASPSPLAPESPLPRSRQGSLRSLAVQQGPQASPVDVRSASALSWETGRDG